MDIAHHVVVPVLPWHMQQRSHLTPAGEGGKKGPTVQVPHAHSAVTASCGAVCRYKTCPAVVGHAKQPTENRVEC